MLPTLVCCKDLCLAINKDIAHEFLINFMKKNQKNKDEDSQK